MLVAGPDEPDYGDATMAKDKPQCPVMNTATGTPGADNRNSLTAYGH